MTYQVFDKNPKAGTTETMCLGKESCPLDNLADSLLRAIAAKEGNSVISPACLFKTLALIANATDSRTRDQLIEALGGEEAIASIAESTDNMEAPECCSNDFRYSTGASLWPSNSLSKGPMLGSHSQLGEGVHIESVAMGSQHARSVMGEWLKANTGGVYLGAPNTKPQDLLVAMGALYLRDSWTGDFDEGGTHAFALDDGTKIDMDFMMSWEQHSIYEMDGALTIAKSLLGGSRMIVSLPPKGRPVSDYVESGEAWRNIMSFTCGIFTDKWAECKLYMPKFEISADGLDIKHLIESMGITEIFQPDADFGPITSDSLMVDDVIQSTRLKIDEQGFEGASYVCLWACAGALPEDPPEPREIYIDRPFAISVVSPEDMPLFVGVVRNPEEVS
ncbi:MAG: serpin family protein [Eggerthellaceae bacterium]|nr:serpin family protein [Eggerthellaceae bacterium]